VICHIVGFLLTFLSQISANIVRNANGPQITSILSLFFSHVKLRQSNPNPNAETSGQRILTKDRIAGAIFHGGENLMFDRPRWPGGSQLLFGGVLNDPLCSEDRSRDCQCF